MRRGHYCPARAPSKALNPMVSVTICSPGSAIGEQWRDLVRRAPSNVFMDPAALTAASVTDFAKITLLLAWD